MLPRSGRRSTRGTTLEVEGSDAAAVVRALEEEAARIHAEDEAYWRPLLDELEQLRHAEARRRRERKT